MLIDEITKEEQVCRLCNKHLIITRRELFALCVIYFAAGALFSVGVCLLAYYYNH